MKKQNKITVKTKVFVAYIFTIIFLMAAVACILVWLLAKDAKTAANVGFSKLFIIGALPIISALIFYVYARTAIKENAELEVNARELKPSPFKVISERTFRVLHLIVNAIFMFDVCVCAIGLTFGQLIVLIPKDALIEAGVSPEAFFNGVYQVTFSLGTTAMVTPIVYVVVDLLLTYLEERSKLVLQQAQDIEEIKNREQK